MLAYVSGGVASSCQHHPVHISSTPLVPVSASGTEIEDIVVTVVISLILGIYLGKGLFCDRPGGHKIPPHYSKS